MARTRRPSPAEVGQRILILSAVQSRARLELEGNATPEGCKGVADWLRSHDLHESASIRELKFVNRPSGASSQQEVIQLSWRAESCGALLWAAGSLPELPPWDSIVDPAGVLEALAGAVDDTAAFVAGIRLRPTEELDRAREIAELWHWRARTTRSMRQGAAPPPGSTFDNIIQAAVEKAVSCGHLPGQAKRDFPAFGKAYRDLSEEEYVMACSIATERLFALNWLCGRSPDADWESTPVGS